MICYHHVDGGMPKDQKARFLQGRHGLVSFEYQSSVEMAYDLCSSVVLDNGAYTHWKNGKGRIDYEAYVEWVRGWSSHPAHDWALIPDVIEGSEHENDEWVKRWPEDLWGVPIWHSDEDPSRLRTLCESCHTVALGSSEASPGSEVWWMQMKPALDAATDRHGRPLAKLHGLRMMDPRIFTSLPLSSADSTNAVRHSNDQEQFGTYVPPSSSERAGVVADRVGSFSSANRWKRVDQYSMFD